jgi:putative nucleotidyltransferase-like protein
MSATLPLEQIPSAHRPQRSLVAGELVRAHEIAQVLEALAADHVVPIVLKGAALAYTVYPSPTMRPRVDTDLLIGRDQIAATRDLLTRRGYVEATMSDGEFVFGQFHMAKVDGWGVEHVFDVHWRISSQSLFASVLTYDDVRANAVSVPALGAHARAAAPAHALLLACVHPVMHHRNTLRPIWFRDIDLLVRRMSTAELHWFAHLAVAKRIACICAHQLSIAVEQFQSPVPVAVMKLLNSASPGEPAAVYLRPHRRWHHELFWNVRNLHGWSNRLRLLREVLFPHPDYMLDAYRLGSIGVVLLPLLYAHRCAYGVLKIVGRRK